MQKSESKTRSAVRESILPEVITVLTIRYLDMSQNNASPDHRRLFRVLLIECQK